MELCLIYSRAFPESAADDYVEDSCARSGSFGILLLGIAGPAHGQDAANSVSDLTRPHDYVLKRSSSYDRSGGNADYRPLAPGDTLTLLDEHGPGEVSHVWITIASDEQYHLKKMVLRMYWDGEQRPSVEAPVGDFFGLGLGDYFLYQAIPLAVGGDKALNCLFPNAVSKARAHYADE